MPDHVGLAAAPASTYKGGTIVAYIPDHYDHHRIARATARRADLAGDAPGAETLNWPTVGAWVVGIAFLSAVVWLALWLPGGV